MDEDTMDEDQEYQIQRDWLIRLHRNHDHHPMPPEEHGCAWQQGTQQGTPG